MFALELAVVTLFTVHSAHLRSRHTAEYAVHFIWAAIRHVLFDRRGLTFASRYRDRVTPMRCGRLKKPSTDGFLQADGLKEPVMSKCKGMCCTLNGIKSKRLKRVFNRAAQVSLRVCHGGHPACSACSSPMRIIVRIPNHSIEDQLSIRSLIRCVQG